MYRRNIIIFFLIVLAASLFWYFSFFQDFFLDVVSFFDAYIQKNEIAGMFVFAGLAALAAMLSPFSSAPLIPIAAVIWGDFLTFLLLAFGWMVGAAASYYIGYSIGFRLLRGFIPFEKIEYYRKKIPQKAEFWLVLAFRLSTPAEIPGYTLGIIRYDFWKFLLATSLSEVPFALISVYASEALVNEEPLIFIGLVGFVILTMTVMFNLFHKSVRGMGEK
jgi:uncharacterized membrane protein YdjX (TVP38/TMEM64 family)